MPKTRQNKRKQQRRRNRTRNPNTILTQAAIPRNLRGASPFPDFMRVKLTGNFNFVMQAAALFNVQEFKANSLYRFFWTSGATNPFSGATQCGNIYDSYHVEKASVSYTICSNESAQPVLFGIIFKDDQPSTSIVSQQTAIDALEVSPTTGVAMVSQTNGQPIFRSRNFSLPLGAVVGNPLSYNSDLSYTASFGSDPTQVVWMAAIAYSDSANLTNGLLVQLKVQLTVRVYSIKPLLQ